MTTASAGTMSALSVACPTCEAPFGEPCTGDDIPALACHAGRVRLARASVAGGLLRYRRFSDGWFNVHHPDGTYVGSVRRFMDEGYTVTAADGTIVTRGFRGPLATAGGLLVNRLAPIPAPENYPGYTGDVAHGLIPPGVVDGPWNAVTAYHRRAD